MVYIVSHTWTERLGRADELNTVRVFSNMDEVELNVNGESLGSRTGLLEWKVPFKVGTNQLVAIGFDRLTRETVVDQIEIYFTAENAER